MVYTHLTIILKFKIYYFFYGVEKIYNSGSPCFFDSYCFFKLGERIAPLLSQMLWQPEPSRAKNMALNKRNQNIGF